MHMTGKLSLLVLVAAVLPVQLYARDALPFPEEESALLSEESFSPVVEEKRPQGAEFLQQLVGRVREEAIRIGTQWATSGNQPFHRRDKRCGYTFRARALGVAFQCASYDVPVHWHDLLLTGSTIADLPNEDKIQLFTRRFGDSSLDAINQLHVLLGGPGEYASPKMGSFISSRFKFPKTAYFFTDHRGTGESNPLKKNYRRFFHGRDVRKILNGWRMPGDKESTRTFRKRLTEYLYALQDTPNHRGLNMINAVLDKVFVVQLFKSFHEARPGANPVQSSLIGFSYGSQLVQNVLALVPRGLIHSIVLVSVPPPKMEPALLNSHGVLDSMQKMLDSCHQNNDAPSACPIPIQSSMEFGRALDRISENQCGLRLRQQLVRHRLAGSGKEASNQFLMTLYRSSTVLKPEKEVDFRTPLMVFFYRLIRCDTKLRDDIDAVKALMVLGYALQRAGRFSSSQGLNQQLNHHQTAHSCTDGLFCEFPGIAKPAGSVNQFAAYLRQHKLVGPVRESIDFIPPVRDSDAYCVGLQGMLDPLVSYKQAKETFADMECAQKTFALLPADGHMLMEKGPLGKLVLLALLPKAATLSEDLSVNLPENMIPKMDWWTRGNLALNSPNVLIKEWKSLMGLSQRLKRWFRNAIPWAPRLD